ncbi:DNA ligase [Thiomicrorhabdus sp.]|uniref:DNA ligase n=1 Tax=Thiomicrorhabdus sp. TaxID=2039724 RepID=UPI002AA6CD25|nr:DNA ligase [Thiomicrorhabdus sp.]
MSLFTMLAKNNNSTGLVKLPGFFVFGLLILFSFIFISQPAKAQDKAEDKTEPQDKLVNSTAPNLMLLKTYQPNQDITGWLMSEKLDGVRAYWDGKHLISRQGNVFNTPKWFIQNFPPFELDGELWLARGRFQEAVSIVRQQTPDNRWKQITYNIFEVPNQQGGLLKRLSILKGFLKHTPNSFIKIIEQKHIQSNQDVEQKLKQILALGGEGLVVRNPTTAYKTGRLSTALKIKQKQDAECIVKSYTKGLGKFTGLVGAIQCELIPEQVIRLFPKLNTLNTKKLPIIKVGSGLSNYQRLHPPKIGSVITFQYMGLTQKGLPRFPVFLRVRNGYKDDKADRD